MVSWIHGMLYFSKSGYYQTCAHQWHHIAIKGKNNTLNLYIITTIITLMSKKSVILQYQNPIHH